MGKILHAGYFEDIIKAFLSMEGEKITAKLLKSGERGGVHRRTCGENNGSGGQAKVT